MALTENLYTGNGTSVLFSFTFPYLLQSDVKVTLDGTATTAYTLANATQIQFTTAPATGVAIRIFRETASDNLSASFFSGASIKADDLNNNFLQNLFVTQESEFLVNQANTTSDQAKTTANTALSTANTASTNASSAVTAANTANTNAAAAQTAATNAANSASSAQTSATAAQTSSTAAQTSATAAVSDAAAAVSTANSAETTANTASSTASTALSTANTASTNASSAVTTANTANTNATAAQTAASNAATDASNAQASATSAQNSATAAAASAATSENVTDAFTATGTPATAITVDVPIDVANGVKLPTNANSYDQEGAIRYNTTLDKIEIRKGSGWSTAAGGASVSSTPPSLATVGDVWYDHDNGRAYVYYNDGDSNQWVEMNPSWNGYVADNSVTSAKIVDGTIVNADVNASAAIAGTKIDPNFGSQTVETTGVFSAAGGAAATPSIAFTGDLNTGIYSPGADQLAVATNGTEQLRIDSSGNVYFGNTSGGSTGTGGLQFSPSNGQLDLVNTNSGSFITAYNRNSTSQVFSVGADGRVSIGTSSADGMLHVKGADTHGSLILEAGGTSGTTNLMYLQGHNNAGVAIGEIAFEETATNQGGFAFKTNGGSLTTKMTLTSGGSLGIGTTSPGGNLTVTDAATYTLDVKSNGGAGALLTILGGSASLALGTNNTERMRITSDGKFGFNTSNPGAFASGANNFVILGNASGTGNAGITIASGSDSNGNIYFGDGTGSASHRGFIVYNHSSDAFQFGTAGSERMRISNEGIIYHNSSNHGIGTFLTQSAGTVKYAFRAHYSSPTGAYGGTESFTVWSNGNVQNTNNSYGAISDIKLKENIVDANSQWDDLKALQVRNYNFIEGQTHTQIGVVAQEVELVSPGLVSESPDRDEDGNDLGTVTKSVNYSVLYMKAVKALQEAMERIETLEQRLSDAGIA